MSYLNGKDVFPAELLEEIQRYVQGACVYIPRCGTKIRKKNLLLERNEDICRRYAAGVSVSRLSEEYYLSKQAIYKILSKNRRNG